MRTSITLKGKEFPVYETKRGYYDFEAAGYSIAQIGQGIMSAIFAFAYYAVKACAKRENMIFPYSSLAEFVDDEEVEIEPLAKLFATVVKKDLPAEQGEAKPAKPEAS